MLIKESPNYTSEASLNAIFAALADPKRRRMLEMLTDGEAMVKELAAPFDVGLPAVSNHLKVLMRAGLVRQGRQAQRRPCRLEPGALKQASDWIAQYRELWQDSLDRLDRYVEGLQAAMQPGGRDEDQE